MEELGLGSLWLQVILVTAATFVASAVIWMAMPWHKGDFKMLPNEEPVRQALLSQGVTHGQYRIPYCKTREEMQSPEFQQRLTTGPVGVFQLEKPGPMTMGPRLIKSLVYYFFVAFYTAYVLRQAVESGDTLMRVFQLGATVSLACHVFAVVPEAIWFSKSWRRVLLTALDGLIFSLITGAIFAKMWPWA